MDPRCPALDNRTAKIFKTCNGSIGIYLENNIPASMKACQYEPTVAFTSEGLLSCTCTCKCGGDHDDRIVCVHILPLIFQLAILLVDGLAENILLELRGRIKATDESEGLLGGNDATEKMKRSIFLLIAATGDTSSFDSSSSIFDLLSHFSVGTENRKKHNIGPPDPNLVGPIRNLNVKTLTSVEKMAIGRMGRSKKSKSKPTGAGSCRENSHIANVSNRSSIILQRNGAGCFESVPCQCCESMLPTNHRCLEIVPGSGIIEDSTKKEICGKAFCIECNMKWGVEENRTRCGFHLPTKSLSSQEVSTARLLNEKAISCSMANNSSKSTSDDPQNDKADEETEDDSIEYETVGRKSNEDIAKQKDDINRKTFDPDYITTLILLEKIGFKKDDPSNPIGIKLALDRGNDVMKGFLDTSSLSVLAEKQSSVEKQWIALLNQSKSRSRKKRGAKRKQAVLNHEPEETQEHVWYSPPMTRSRYATFVSVSNAKPRVRKGPKAKQYCAFVGCKNNELSGRGITLHRIQDPPPYPGIDSSEKRARTYYKKKKKRERLLRRCGHPSSLSSKGLRICNAHPLVTETVPVSFNYPMNNIDYTQTRSINFSFQMQTPATDGVKLSTTFSSPTKTSKGLGKDRRLKRILNINNDIECEERNNDQSWAMALQQVLENQTPLKSSDMNPAVAEACNIELSKQQASISENKRRVLWHTTIAEEEQDKKLISNVDHAILPPDVKPHLALMCVGDDSNICSRSKKRHEREVKRRTGFFNEKTLLAFIVIVCNGDFDLMTKRNTVLTWYEEWYFFFEMLWGRTINRWEDAESIKHGFGINQTYLRNVFKSKLDLVMVCRSSWPLFAKYKEDKKFCPESFTESYEGMRPIFWDMTNIHIPKPSESQLQRLTFSSYYGENCFKGAIGLQQCGWIVTHDLWTGNVSDTQYQEESGLFEMQKEFAEHDLVDGKNIPVTNVFDKGYRTRLAAWRNGKQLTLQPYFAKSDRKFNRKQTISSAQVAADRSGNERAVRLSKLSGYLKRGLSNTQRLESLDKVWLTWGFQTNFMFDQVL